MMRTKQKEEMTMKKFLATVITLFLWFGLCNRAYALTPADLEPQDVITSDVYEQTDISKYNAFEDISNMLKEYCLKEYEKTGNKLIWAISSLNNHQNVQYYILKNKDINDYKKMVNTIDEDVDFIQIATLMDNGKLDTLKKSFEKDVTKAALQIILPVDSDYEEVYTDIIEIMSSALKENNIPIYWNVKESNTDVFVIESAIRKYIIQPGDTLSQIALNYNTSVEEILKDNKNIVNPDLIYAYDYLIIN